ncbi:MULTISPECIES: hypothetical protein [Streptomyces]|uniref:hypothetical protein n=1 Tax=Streptomyces TaxID=1883 RepID=UPI00081B9A64|nr:MULTISPECIES: hypothetical protein [unclassified Streptomyces]MYQ51229.1 hypothetical protein [Streptomyces sp. SID4941]SCD56689.1 hypothetical protein GA0115247_10819 [Streptomyces sp. PalvLS-984]SDD45721.1 hypothetical protein F558DRAFT_04099 [Streptomyces sp. AmelKG-A3]
MGRPTDTPSRGLARDSWGRARDLEAGQEAPAGAVRPDRERERGGARPVESGAGDPAAGPGATGPVFRDPGVDPGAAGPQTGPGTEVPQTGPGTDPRTDPRTGPRTGPDPAAPQTGPDPAAPQTGPDRTRTPASRSLERTGPRTGGPGSGAAPGGVPTAVRAPEIAYRPGRGPGARRGPADPVKALMHRHHDLCERAVDPLEIAAGLEAHGLTDRAAARYRHRDVFSLAEELYARAPGASPSAPSHPPRQDPADEARARWTLLAMLPGAACLATAGVLRATEGVLGAEARFAVTAFGALLTVLGLRLSLRGGPLRAPDGAGGVTLYVCWLLGYAVYGDDLLAQVLSGGPDGTWTAAPAALLGLASAVAPAAWCAHLFAVHAHRRLAGSHALAEFGVGVRPALFGVVALQLCAVTALLCLAGLGHGGGAVLAPAALGVLLFLARLLTVHGFPEAAATGLAVACTAELAAVFLVLAGRLPGLTPLARPVDVLVATAGTGAVPLLACGVAALGLLIHASLTLTRASAHATA